MKGQKNDEVEANWRWHALPQEVSHLHTDYVDGAAQCVSTLVMPANPPPYTTNVVLVEQGCKIYVLDHTYPLMGVTVCWEFNPLLLPAITIYGFWFHLLLEFGLNLAFWLLGFRLDLVYSAESGSIYISLSSALLVSCTSESLKLAGLR